MSMLDDIKEMMARLGPPPDRYEIIHGPNVVLGPDEVLLINRTLMERQLADLLVVPMPLIELPKPESFSWMASLQMRVQPMNLAPFMTISMDMGGPYQPDRRPGWRKRLRKRLLAVGIRNWRRFARLQAKDWARAQK